MIATTVPVDVTKATAELSPRDGAPWLLLADGLLVGGIAARLLWIAVGLAARK